MKKVTIEPGCITCGTCEFLAPDVFEVTDICRVKKNVDTIKQNENIKQAVKACPVSVIAYRDE